MEEFRTRVLEAEQGKNYTNIRLEYHPSKFVEAEVFDFTLPLLVRLEKNDEIWFIGGDLTKEYRARIKHENYVVGTIYRDGKELLMFNSKDMKFLSELQEGKVKPLIH